MSVDVFVLLTLNWNIRIIFFTKSSQSVSWFRHGKVGLRMNRLLNLHSRYIDIASISDSWIKYALTGFGFGGGCLLMVVALHHSQSGCFACLPT